MSEEHPADCPLITFKEQLVEGFFSSSQEAVVTSRRILYTPSVFARSNLLYLQEIGELKAQQPHVSRRSNLGSFLFFTVVSGCGSLNFEGQKYRLNTGDCVFIDCGQQYSHTTDAENLWTLKWVHFYGQNMSGIYQKYRERGGKPVFHPEKMAPFTDVWVSLMDRAGSSDYIRDMRINEGLNTLLTLLMEQSWCPEENRETPRKRNVIFSVKEYLEQHPEEKITLDSLASGFYINKFYLAKAFKQYYGMTVNAYLLQIRITRAKQMLRFSDKSMKEIGLECGLGDEHYFSARFKEVEGVPPSIYRAQW